MSTNYDVRFHCFLPTAGQDHNRQCFVETPYGGSPAMPTWRTVSNLELAGGSAFYTLPDSSITFGATTRTVSAAAGGWVEFRESGSNKIVASGTVTFLKFDSASGNTNFMVNFSPAQPVVKLK